MSSNNIKIQPKSENEQTQNEYISLKVEEREKQRLKNLF